jgi:hypothetical protein
MVNSYRNLRKILNINTATMIFQVLIFNFLREEFSKRVQFSEILGVMETGFDSTQLVNVSGFEITVKLAGN